MKKFIPSLEQRKSGVLLHITSLPTPGPIGRLGDSAIEFLDFLKSSGQHWWQTLPINPIGKGDSPYSTISSFAGEAMLTDLNVWQRHGYIPKSRKGPLLAKTNFRQAGKEFTKFSRQAFANFQKSKSGKFANGLRQFVRKQADWLNDYSLFCAISNDYGTDWTKWPDELRNRLPAALKAAREHWHDEIEFQNFLQYSFDLSWHEFRNAAADRGIGLIGDIPIFVAHDSADVWANQKYFCLNKDGTPQVVAGVPPDYFNKDGQLWGNALYKWPALQRDGFDFWVRRLQRLLDLYDVIRVDHFIGFFRYWEIPATAKSAKTGKWKMVPGVALFEKLQKVIGPNRMIAEDLGLLVPGVVKLRDQFKIPGMRVLQFAFGNGGGGGYHMPYECPKNSVAYTGTHDNDTVNGWYDSAKKQSKSPKPAFDFLRIQGALGDESKNCNWRAISTVGMSPANTCMMQMQDILGLDSRARMNVPGTPTGNWQWRMQSIPDRKVASKLKEIMAGCNRI